MSRTTVNVHVHTNEDTHTRMVTFDDFISVDIGDVCVFLKEAKTAWQMAGEFLRAANILTDREAGIVKEA